METLTIWANDIQNVHVQAKSHFQKNKMEYSFYQIPSANDKALVKWKDECMNGT